VANDLIFHLVLTNLAGAAAILAVLALRGPARAQLGAGMAYALWLIIPAAMLASLFPARTVLVPAPVVTSDPMIDLTHEFIATSAMPHSIATGSPLDVAQILVGVWLAGVMGSLIVLAIGQHRALGRFGRITTDANDPHLARAANSRVGPALVGVVRPRVVVPNDFEARFEADERAMILAHERMHLSRGHASINGLTALLKAVNWFNPLVHLAARYARVDQELACDAAVVGRLPWARQTYAQALLKTQLAFMPMPLGCDWPVRSPSLLEKRIEMLAQPKPGRVRLLGGAVLIAALTASAGLAAWSAVPADVQFTASPVRDGASPQSSPMPAVAPSSDDRANKYELGPKTQNPASAEQRPKTVAAGYGTAAPNEATAAPTADAQAPAAAAALPVAPSAVAALGQAPGSANQSDAAMVYDGVSPADVQRRVQLLIFERGVQPTEQALFTIKMEAFSGLVNEHLELQEEERVQNFMKQRTPNYSLIPSDKEVDDAVADLAKKNNNLTYDQLKAKFAAAGVDLSTLREQVRTQIGWQRLIVGIGRRFTADSSSQPVG
jgi:beta-lactamase regulating signal transducer with metallopeptidase domain